MKFITGPLNKKFLLNLLNEVISEASRVKAAIAYAKKDNLKLFEACRERLLPLEFYGRYDYTVAIDPDVLKWFIEKASPNLVCKLVPDILHSKVIWWIDAGAYIGSANLTDRAWNSNIEAGVFLTQYELSESGMEEELRSFFEEVDERSRPLSKEIYEEQRRLKEERSALSTQDYKLEQDFDKKRLLPKNRGLSFSEGKRPSDKPFKRFDEEWNSALQIMRSLAGRVSDDNVRPAWIEKDVPAGVQADQFLHAYYYKQVKDGNRHPYEEFHARSSKNPEIALQETLKWWRKGDFDHWFEERTIYEWAPTLRELFAKDRILKLNKKDFIQAISRVHAIRDHATKQENEHLGLPKAPQDADLKVEKFGEWLWKQRSAEGKSPLEMFDYVIWGDEAISKRIWNAIRTDKWRIPHLSISSLGEIVGWVRPDDYPPRNMRTSKGLRALGYNVKIGM